MQQPQCQGFNYRLQKQYIFLSWFLPNLCNCSSCCGQQHILQASISKPLCNNWAARLGFFLRLPNLTSIDPGGWKKSCKLCDFVQEGFQVVKTPSRNWQQHANFWTQCWSLTRRSFTNMKRDIGYYWLRSIIYFLLSICLGTIYWRIGFQYSSILVSIFLSWTWTSTSHILWSDDPVSNRGESISNLFIADANSSSSMCRVLGIRGKISGS